MIRSKNNKKKTQNPKPKTKKKRKTKHTSQKYVAHNSRATCDGFFRHSDDGFKIKQRNVGKCMCMCLHVPGLGFSMTDTVT